MKPFNLGEYLANPSQKVMTRDGRPVRIICTDKRSDYPIVASVKEPNGDKLTLSYTKKGEFFSGTLDEKDLFFTPEKNEGWVNVFKDTCGNRGVGSRIFNSKEDAEKEAKNFNDYITTIKIEWEE